MCLHYNALCCITTIPNPKYDHHCIRSNIKNALNYCMHFALDGAVWSCNGCTVSLWFLERTIMLITLCLMYTADINSCDSWTRGITLCV